MTRRSHSVIAASGWPLIALALVLAAVSGQFNQALALFFVLMAVLLSYLFRDPWRTVPSDPLAIVCPVDGVVEAVALHNNPLTAHRDQRVSIRLHKGGAFTVHSPIEGKILTLRRDAPDVKNRGKYVRALSILVRTDEGDDVVLVIHRGFLGHYPRYYQQAGERVGQGGRLSYVPFGTRVDVYIPGSSSIDVNVGDKLSAGASKIGHLVHHKSSVLGGSYDSRARTQGSQRSHA